MQPFSNRKKLIFSAKIRILLHIHYTHIHHFYCSNIMYKIMVKSSVKKEELCYKRKILISVPSTVCYLCNCMPCRLSQSCCHIIWLFISVRRWNVSFSFISFLFFILLFLFRDNKENSERDEKINCWTKLWNVQRAGNKRQDNSLYKMC